MLRNCNDCRRVAHCLCACLPTGFVWPRAEVDYNLPNTKTGTALSFSVYTGLVSTHGVVLERSFLCLDSWGTVNKRLQHLLSPQAAKFLICHNTVYSENAITGFYFMIFFAMLYVFEDLSLLFTKL